MAKFVDINSLTEKVNPDGNEQIQVSDTQKFVWKNALMNSGGFIGAILSYATQYAMGNTTDRQTIISMLGQLFYNTGSRADSFFRFVCGSVTIPGGTPKQEYFGVVFYDAYYTRTYAVFFGFENNSVPITFFQRQGNYVTDSPIDDNFVTNIINGTSWTKLGTLDFTALLKQTYGTNTQFLAPVQGSEVLLTTTIERILYALGFRGANTNFRFLTGVNSTSETYWGVAFYNSGQSKTFTVLFGIGGSSLPVGMYQKSGNVTAQKSVDSEFIQDVLSTWTKSWSLNSQGTIYTSDVIAATSDKPITLPGQFAFPSLTDLKTDAFVKQMIYNSGYHQSGDCFRQLIAPYVIGGTGSQVQCYYGVTWYNGYYGRTYTMLVNMERVNGEYITLYRKQGRHIESNPMDDVYINDVLTGDWLKVAGIGTGGSTAEQIVAGSSGSPLDVPSAYVGWNPTSMSVEQALSILAYAAGIRSVNEGTLSAPFRIITQTTSGSGLTIVSYMPADKESLKWEFGYGFIRMFHASGNLLANNPTDNVLLMNAAWESYPIRISELLGVNPFDQLTSVSSLKVKAGDNIRASASTLSVLVGGANVFSQNNEYMRDAVIVANYDATVGFTAKDSSVVVRKSADVGTVTATSGKKVYTLHWAPAALQGGKVSNWEVFVNVAVYA